MSFAALDDVLAEVDELGRRFTAAGHRLYLVGGIVRDQWLDLPLDDAADIDLTTDARPDQIKALVAGWADVLWTQGERFGTIGMRAGRRAYEVTTHRAESYNSESRKPVVNFGDDIGVDLSRRDFTVNAMAIDVERRMLVDPWGGAADLEAGVLRTPLAPEVSFTDDPLRMLRAARFAAKYELRLDPDVVAAAAELSARLRIVAIERIGDELERLLELVEPAMGLDFLSTTGVLAEVLCYGHPDMIDDVTPRLTGALEVVARVDADWRLRLAAVGVAVFVDEAGVASLCRRLRLSRDDSRYIVELARGALAVLDNEGNEPVTLRRWRVETMDPVRSLSLARALSPDSPAVARFDSAVTELVESEGDGGELLDGRAMMSLLGISPGRDVGDALEFLRQCYYERGPLHLDEQQALIRDWWSDRPTNA